MRQGWIAERRSPLLTKLAVLHACEQQHHRMASRILLFIENLYMGEQICATDLTHSQSSVSGSCKSASIWSVYISRVPHGKSGA